MPLADEAARPARTPKADGGAAGRKLRRGGHPHAAEHLPSFPEHYKRVVFVSAGVIDSGGFKGEHDRTMTRRRDREDAGSVT